MCVFVRVSRAACERRSSATSTFIRDASVAHAYPYLRLTRQTKVTVHAEIFSSRERERERHGAGTGDYGSMSCVLSSSCRSMRITPGICNITPFSRVLFLFSPSSKIDENRNRFCAHFTFSFCLPQYNAVRRAKTYSSGHFKAMPLSTRTPTDSILPAPGELAYLLLSANAVRLLTSNGFSPLLQNTFKRTTGSPCHETQ